MKNNRLVLLLLFVLLPAAHAFAQSASVTWPLDNTTQLTSTSSGNVTGSAESISSGSGQFGMSVFDYTVDGQRLWEGTAGWIAGAEESTRYIQFDATPASGNSFTVTGVSFNYRDFANTTDTNYLNGNVYYSIDNWANRVQLNGTIIYLNSTPSAFNTAISVAIASGQTFSLRIYPFAVHNSEAARPTFATHNTVVISGTTAPEVLDTGSISGMKFNDLNGNGVRDVGEPGLPDWQIKLSGAADSTITTDQNGNYSFNNLAAGTYTIAEIYQSGWQQTTQSAYTVTLAAGQQLENIDFGNRLDDPSESCVKWDLMSTGLVTSTSGNISGQPEIIGPGPNSQPMTIYGYSNGQQLWVGNFGGTWVAAPLDITRYAQFDVSPTPGNSFTVSDISFNYGDLPWGSDFNIVAFQAYYSTDGWNTAGTVLNSTPLVYKNTAMLPFSQSLSGVTVSGGQTFSLRIYPYAVQHGITIIPTFATHNNVEICGTTEPEIVPGCVTPPDSMVAWWPFDETSGATSVDLAGFNNSGTRINGPVPAPSKVLGGLQFDGINDYVETPDHPELNFGAGDFSIDAWIKTSDNTSYNTIIVDKQTLNGQVIRGYSFYLTVGYLSLQLSDGQFTNYGSLVFVADGNWHHVGVTVSRGLHNGIIFYKDGAASPVGDPTARPGSLDNTSPLTIGRQSYADQLAFTGTLDEIELFNRVLTPAEILSIFSAGSSGKCKPPTAKGNLAPPTGFAVSDVPNDQGNLLQLSWTLSTDESGGKVTTYRIYRSRSATMTYATPRSQFTALDDLNAWEASHTVLADSVAAGVSQYTDFIPLNDAIYYYWLQAVGASGVSKIAAWTPTVTAVSETPKEFRVAAPYPNPFNPSVTIGYTLPGQLHVRLTIYDSLGRAVAVLEDGLQGAGRHEAVWNGRSDQGETLGSGVYLYRIEAGAHRAQGKMTLLR